MMAAEVYAVYGVDGGGGGLTVSAPVAPITKTASLAHPLFDAGFEGAELFGILVSEPQATRVMCALLAFHDLLNPDAPSRASSAADSIGRVAAVMGEQIHGGVYAQPHSLEREIGVAAVAGLVRRPQLVPPAVRFLVRGRQHLLRESTTRRSGPRAGSCGGASYAAPSESRSSIWPRRPSSRSFRRDRSAGP